jgi:hypothetical protein
MPLPSDSQWLSKIINPFLKTLMLLQFREHKYLRTQTYLIRKRIILFTSETKIGNKYNLVYRLLTAHTKNFLGKESD